MNKKDIAFLSAVVIVVGSIGGVVFAANAGSGTQKDTQQALVRQEVNSNINSANNPSKDERKDMIKIIRDNGFKDAARYMQTGDNEKMNEFMNNLSEEDFQKMLEVMRENGYESKAQMMELMGREGMIQMHNSMDVMHSEGTDMSSMHAAGSGMMS